MLIKKIELIIESEIYEFLLNTYIQIVIIIQTVYYFLNAIIVLCSKINLNKELNVT